MTVKEIREIAKQHGIKAAKMKKAGIIRAIQKAEGNFECFGSATAGECSQFNCSWRTDCLSGS